MDTTKESSFRNLYGPRESWRIVKNMVMLGLTFTLIFTAFSAMANLQSSINSEEGIGLYSLAACYGAFLTSSLFLPPFFIARLKSKWTLLFAVSGYVLYQSAQYYPRFATLVPAALCLGTTAALLWTSQGSYLTIIAEEYAHLTNQKTEGVIQRFFGAFFLFFHSSQVWGNMISSFVLANPEALANFTMDYAQCGANFCPVHYTISVKANFSNNGSLPNLDIASEESGNKHRPETWKINTLTSIFIGSTVCGGLVILFLVDSLKRYGENERKLNQNEKWYSLFLATIKHWKKPKQLLVIPVSVWLGMQEAFIGAEFTQAYISCALGVESIGFIMMCFGICAAISSLWIGKAMQYVGRPAVFIGASLLDIACFVTMLKWTPNRNEPFIFYAIAGVWGLADGVWSPQIKAMYGSVFPNTREAAFSNTGLWLSIGFIIIYLNADTMCMETKLYLYMGILVFAMICYGIVEILTRLKK